ncbi:uncharacterized protein LOC143248653 [Tachypleus tridentatus]|uniref:uncharacterized protein LOC143248653 n=1 Tax=Tachypleus tridentatus TaxID=6853 RepID=UPI003FD0D410
MSFMHHKLFFCNVCGKEFSGPVPFKIHMESKSHEKMLNTWKLKKEMQSVLKAESSFDNFVSSVEAHSNDTKHDCQPALQNLQTQPDSIQDWTLICKCCAVRFSGPECAKQHFESPKHNKKMQRLALEKSLMTTLRNPDVTQNGKQESNYRCNNVNTDRICDDMESGAELVNESLQTTSNFISEFKDYPLICQCCAVRFSGPECAKQHFESSRHMKKLKNLDLAENLQKYRNQERKDSYSEAITDKISDNSESKSEAVGEKLQARCDNLRVSEHQSCPLMCKYCAVSFTGPECAEQHFKSAKHCKKVQMFDLPQTLMKMSINRDTTENENQESNDTCIKVHTDGTYKDTECEDATANESHLTGPNTFISQSEDCPLSCEVCAVMFTNTSCINQHFKSIQHKKKLQSVATGKNVIKLPTYSDHKEADNRELNAENMQSLDNKFCSNKPDILQQFYNSHTKKMDKPEIIPWASSNSGQLEDQVGDAKLKNITRDSDDKRDVLKCDICNISHFNDITEAFRHYEGEEHGSRKKAMLSSCSENHLRNPCKETKIMNTEVLDTAKTHVMLDYTGIVKNENVEEFYSCVDIPSNNSIMWPKLDSLLHLQAKNCTGDNQDHSKHLNIFEPSEKFNKFK